MAESPVILSRAPLSDSLLFRSSSSPAVSSRCESWSAPEEKQWLFPPSRYPTKSLNHLNNSACRLKKGVVNWISSNRLITSWLKRTRHRRKLSYTSGFRKAFLTLSKKAYSLSEPNFPASASETSRNTPVFCFLGGG
jgi:hypothetical protein